MAKSKEPIDLLVLKGKKNLTKQEIKERKEQEEAMKGASDKVIPPSYLTAKQKREFEELAAELMEISIFSNLDVDSLTRFLDSKYQYMQLVKDMKKLKPTENIVEAGRTITVANDEYSKLVRVKNTLFTECRQAANDLGLSVSSRLKLIIPKTNKEQPKSEAERRFRDRL